MSENSLKQIITRAVVDAEFRTLLLSNPVSALTGYELTDEEKAIFKNLSPEAFEALAGTLDERISRAQASGYLYRTAVCQAYTDAC